MPLGHVLRSLPGHVAAVLAVVVTTLAGVTGAQSLFYEGWGQPAQAALTYLLPWAACLVLGLVAFRWPRTGGALLIGAALVGAALWLRANFARFGQSSTGIQTAVVVFAPLLGLGGLFLLEARHRRLLRAVGTPPPASWVARHHRWLLLVGLSALGLGAVAVDKLPERLARHDDGLRGARVVDTNGVRLVWAPAGPGWNWLHVDGAYPSWDLLASYGVAPVGMKPPAGRAPGAGGQAIDEVGLCAFLDAEGTGLLAAPARIWRMPTADEVIRSLTRDGENAGCVWDGRSSHAVCRVPPDKETPLWAPDQPPIYILTGGVRDGQVVLGVNYTGGITPFPFHARGAGYRCVKPLL
jgi:hypothetical protein